MNEKSLMTQIEQKNKAYATLMDQFNKQQSEKNELQAENKSLAKKLAESEASKRRVEVTAKTIAEDNLKKEEEIQRLSSRNHAILSEVAELFKRIMEE